jgi:4-amino-4-deoxy-L-arabinose transferase-like glycosyltransferase
VSRVAAWACALLACLNAACWSIVTPPFQVLDEANHFAYVQELAENGRLPLSNEEEYSPEETTVLDDLHFPQIVQNPQTAAISSRAEQRRLEHDLALPLSQRGDGDAGVATSQPPLYYALETIPYTLGSAGTELDRLQLMRLLSALLAGFTALFTFLFVREALPAVPWAWTVGGLGVTLTPLLGEMSGGVNPDAMLYAVSAAAFYLLARAFRRELTTRLAIAIGAVTAIGFITKLNFLGLAPGIILGLIVLTRRAKNTSGRIAYRSLALAAAVAVSPLIPYMVSNALSNHPILGLASSVISISGEHGSMLGEISYIWQLYLPPLPGMHNDFPGIFTTRQIWFNGLVGVYGWHDAAFPGWIYSVALIPAGLIAGLCIRALIVCRAALRRRLAELAVYAAMSLGVLALIGASAYVTFISEGGVEPEARYLFPLLALWGVVLTLAARGAGRRWGPIAGAAIVLLILAQDVFAQLLVVSRYYPG